MWVEKSSEAQNKIKSDWYIKTFPENHFSIDLILAQFYLLYFGTSGFFWLYLAQRYAFLAKMICHLKKTTTHKSALNSLTQFYVTVIISFCYYATEN